jgi:hypothetical protein
MGRFRRGVGAPIGLIIRRSFTEGQIQCFAFHDGIGAIPSCMSVRSPGRSPCLDTLSLLHLKFFRVLVERAAVRHARLNQRPHDAVTGEQSDRPISWQPDCSMKARRTARLAQGRVDKQGSTMESVTPHENQGFLIPDRLLLAEWFSTSGGGPAGIEISTDEYCNSRSDRHSISFHTSALTVAFLFSHS